MPDEELEAIRYALNLARDKGFSEVDLRFGGIEFEATLSPNGVVPARGGEFIESESAAIELEEPGTRLVEAPCVGYFQQGKVPLSEGRHVQQGEIVAAISALGLANDVEAPFSGEIVDVLVTDGQPVEYGQPLARVKVKE